MSVISAFAGSVTCVQLSTAVPSDLMLRAEGSGLGELLPRIIAQEAVISEITSPAPTSCEAAVRQIA